MTFHSQTSSPSNMKYITYSSKSKREDKTHKSKQTIKTQRKKKEKGYFIRSDGSDLYHK